MVLVAYQGGFWCAAQEAVAVTAQQQLTRFRQSCQHSR